MPRSIAWTGSDRLARQPCDLEGSDLSFRNSVCAGVYEGTLNAHKIDHRKCSQTSADICRSISSASIRTLDLRRPQPREAFPYVEEKYIWRRSGGIVLRGP